MGGSKKDLKEFRRLERICLAEAEYVCLDGTRAGRPIEGRR